MKRSTIFLSLAAALALLWNVSLGAQEKGLSREAKETLLLDQAAYPVVGEKSGMVSPDLRHVAVAVRDKDGWFMVVDGKTHRKYDGILENTPMFSADGSSFWYMAVKGKRGFVVVNGEESGPYDGLGGGVISEDGDHVAYKVSEGDQYYVVHDGRQSPPGGTKEWLGYLQLSPDGRRLAFKVRCEGGWRMVVDGDRGAVFQEMSPPVFSPDGAHVAYAVQAGEVTRVVLDGVEGPPCEGLGAMPVFGPDGGRLAYLAMEGKKTHLVLGGERGPGYDFVPPVTLTFSPDGKRCAYTAVDGGRQFMVVDGVPHRDYEAMSLPRFSPDGGHLAYAALKKKNRSIAVLDGEELEGVYDNVMDVTFSPDSRKLAFVAGLKKSTFAVVDGEESRHYENVGSLVFSPDSRHLAFLATDRKKMFIVVDGVEGKRYDAVLKPPTPEGRASRNVVFDSSETFHYLAREGGKIFLVEERIQSPVPGT